MSENGQITSWRRGQEGGQPLPEGAKVGYPRVMRRVVQMVSTRPLSIPIEPKCYPNPWKMATRKGGTHDHGLGGVA